MACSPMGVAIQRKKELSRLGQGRTPPCWRRANGKLEIAGQDLAHVLHAREHVHGPEREATLHTAVSLALNLRLRGQRKEAKELYQLVLQA
jgi:hypothetical protein